MKNLPFILICGLCSFTIQAQIPQTKSVTISPLAGNVEEVNGNIRSNGTIQGNSLKAAGLATGDPFKANPVYANVDGTLVTGYKVNYLNVPPVAFRLDIVIQSEGEVSGLGYDLLIYSGGLLGLYQVSTSKNLLAPLSFPHKSKLSALKFTFASNDPLKSRALTGQIIKASINDFSNGVSIFFFTTPASANGVPITVDLPIDLIEIDSQNYVYTLMLSSNTNDWIFTTIRGVIIEYRDL